MDAPRLLGLEELTAQSLLPQVEAVYVDSFEEDEIVPFEWLLRACQGTAAGRFRYDLRGLVEGEELAGMIWYGYSRALNFGYLGYLAVSSVWRGQGCGSWMVKSTFDLLRDMAQAESGKDPRLTFWEVRNPADAHSPQEAELRRSRIRFYARLGGQMLPVDYTCPPVAPGQPEVSYCLMARTYPSGGLVSLALLLEAALAGLIDINYADPDSHYVRRARESIRRMEHASSPHP